MIGTLGRVGSAAAGNLVVVIVRLVPLVLLVAGCAGGQAAEDVTSVAGRFESAVQAKDFGQACRLLSPEVQESLDDCAAELQEAALPAVAGAATASVYGQNGIVKWPGETVFVSRFPGGWRVTAAGCHPRAQRPYDCAISGG